MKGFIFLNKNEPKRKKNSLNNRRMKMSDLEKAMAGDKEAFSRIIIQNKESMYKTAIVILKNEDDAYDALQEAAI